MIRLDKLVADTGRFSRKEARVLFRAGRIRVDGVIPTGIEEKFDPDVVCLEIDGQVVETGQFRYYMLHKPAGVVTATEDAVQQTVMDLFPLAERRMGLFPVGRLDKDTTGLLLLTNHGALAHELLSPRYHVPKRYIAEIAGDVTPEDCAAFAAGLVLGSGEVCLPAELQSLGAGKAVVVLHEGKYHQVKRMFAARGKPVLHLHRVSFGSLVLPEDLLPGQWRSLTAVEKRRILNFRQNAI